MPEIKLRESIPVGYVRVLEDDREVFRDREYRSAAEYAQRTYNLSDGETMALYRPYRDDYDAIPEDE